MPTSHRRRHPQQAAQLPQMLLGHGRVQSIAGSGIQSLQALPQESPQVINLDLDENCSRQKGLDANAGIHAW